MPRHSHLPFSLGVNYPWLNYGSDFGSSPGGHRGIGVPAGRLRVDQDFAQIQEMGATVVRWFLFGDGRCGFVSKEGIPERPDGSLLADVAATLQLAERYRLRLCFSLIDYLWLQEHAGRRAPHAHEHVLHFPAGREAFLQNVLIPLFREFRGHPALFAWEIANEPEWAIRQFHRKAVAKMHFAEFRAYAAEIARAIHEYADAPVTLGSARLIWVRAWTELGLDYYQAHFYPAGETETRRDLAQQLAALPPLDKPLWLGELPARDPVRPEYSLRESLDICRRAGLCGAAVWRWTEPGPEGTDAALGRMEPAELKAWSSEIRGDPEEG
jgi:hypothetical protein